MIQQLATVLWNEPVGPGYRRLGLGTSEAFAEASPGQFVMLRIPDRISPLLRRPFSVHRRIASAGAFQGIALLYRVVGEVTRIMATLEEGDAVDIVGPLGTSFSVSPHARRVYLAAGGIGVAPLVFLLDTLTDSGLAAANIRAFIGGRSRQDLLCVQDFLAAGVAVHTTTDDGTGGDSCLVTDPLERAVGAEPPDVVCACGPPGMLACVAGIARTHGVSCQVSVEAMMACGMGACLGCAMESGEIPARYLHACLDGPVMEASRLSFNFR